MAAKIQNEYAANLENRGYLHGETKGLGTLFQTRTRKQNTTAAANIRKEAGKDDTKKQQDALLSAIKDNKTT